MPSHVGSKGRTLIYYNTTKRHVKRTLVIQKLSLYLKKKVPTHPCPSKKDLFFPCISPSPNQEEGKLQNCSTSPSRVNAFPDQLASGKHATAAAFSTIWPWWNGKVNLRWRKENEGFQGNTMKNLCDSELIFGAYSRWPGCLDNFYSDIWTSKEWTYAKLLPMPIALNSNRYLELLWRCCGNLFDFYIPGGAGFLPSTVVSNDNVWTRNHHPVSRFSKYMLPISIHLSSKLRKISA